jgi:hypothetical protein
MTLRFASAVFGLAIMLPQSLALAQSQQPVDPTAELQQMIRQQDQLDAQRHQNEAMRLELERRDLEDQLRYRNATDPQIMGELARYCPPNGEPPCSSEPPQSLLQEATKRGLIQFSSQRPSAPSADCVTLGDGMGGGVTDCAIH